MSLIFPIDQYAWMRSVENFLKQHHTDIQRLWKRTPETPQPDAGCCPQIGLPGMGEGSAPTGTGPGSYNEFTTTTTTTTTTTPAPTTTTTSSTTTSTTTTTTPQPIYAVHFDGGDDFISASDAGLPSGGATRSICFWMKTNANFSSFQTALNYGTDANGQAVYIYSYSMVGTQAGLVIDTYGGGFGGSAVVNDGNWHWVCITCDGSGNWVMFVDNSNVGSGTMAHGTNTTLGGTLRLGKGSATNPWEVTVDDVRIYDIELTAGNRNSIYNSGSGSNADPIGSGHLKRWYLLS